MEPMPTGAGQKHYGGEGTAASALLLTPDAQPIPGGGCSLHHSLAAGGLQGAMQQARFESDSRVIKIRNNAILQQDCRLPAHINDSFSNSAKECVLCVLGEPTQPENLSIFLEKGACNQSSIPKIVVNDFKSKWF